jgi:hypothetical protein
MIDAVDHIGVATDDVDALALRLAALFDCGSGPRTEHGGIAIRFVQVDAVRLELLEPLDHPSLERFLARDGPGLHHLALACADLDATVETLSALGVEPLADTPDRGVEGRRICFLPPAAVGGTLIELVETDG